MRRDMVVVTDTNFVIFDSIHKKIKTIPHNCIVTTIGELYDKAIDNEVYNIWISPYTKIVELFTMEHVNKHNNIYLVKGSRQTEEGLISFIRMWKIGYKDVTFTIPENNHLWKFNEYEDVSPNDLLIMLITLKDNLPIHILNSPTSLGIDLLEYSTPNDNQHWLRSCDFEIGNIPLATNLVWKSNNIVNPKKYFHTIDRRGSYLSSYNSTLLGSGNSKHFTNIDFDYKKIGVWKVELTSTDTQYDGNMLPVPYNTYATDNWLWTPEIKIASMLGYDVKVHEADLWEEGHYIFREWSRILWSSRETLEEKYKQNNIFGYQMAIDTIKKIYTQTGGRLAHRGNLYDRKDVYQRFDWYSMIVADNRLKVLWTVNNLLKLGLYPILIDNDEIGYLSSEIDPLKAIPTISEKNGVGSFKPKYSLEWSNISQQFQDLSVNKLKELLKQLKKDGKTLT